MAKKTRKPPSVGLDKFIVRLPPGLRDKLHALAKASGRSANAELVDRLEKSMVEPDKNLRDLVEDQDILRTEVADLRRMVEKMKHDSDAMLEKIKQDYPGRYEAILMELKGDPKPER
jgi:hypothetical protein